MAMCMRGNEDVLGKVKANYMKRIDCRSAGNNI